MDQRFGAERVTVMMTLNSKSAGSPLNASVLRPHLLIVDDDEDIRGLVMAQLGSEEYRLSEAANIRQVRSLISAGPVDLIVLDLGLPDGDGLALCRELRADGHDAAIIMVTARDSAIDRVLGLELGADDYLIKPFEPRELTARIRLLLRRDNRQSRTAGNVTVAHFGDWRLDLIKRRLIAADDSLVMLSAGEFEILLRLIQSPNQPLSRELLLPSRAATASFDRTIDNQISRLRQKLAQGKTNELIMTVRNQGYLLATTVTFA